MALHPSSSRGRGTPAWWIGILFAIGSLCFMIGPFPGFVDLVGSAADGTVFFVGSIFFTVAAFIQFLHSGGGDRAATLIQLVGTVFFNVDTYRAMQAAYDNSDVDRLIWRPEAIGSVCFLVSGVLAYLTVRHLRHRSRRSGGSQRSTSAVVSSSGFLRSPGTSCLSSGSALDLAAANWSTALGALCFLIGAVMILPRFAGSLPEQGRQRQLTCESGRLIPARKSGRLDLNQRPFGPQSNALPDCATPRGGEFTAAAKRATGIEPAPRAWKALVQPLHHARGPCAD